MNGFDGKLWEIIMIEYMVCGISCFILQLVMILIKSFLLHTRPLFFSLFNGLLRFHAKKWHILITISPYSSPGILHLKKSIKDVSHPNSSLSTDIYFQIVADTHLKLLPEGSKIYQQILWSKAHFRDPALLEKLSLMYLSCNKMEVARLFFDEISKPSIFLYNAMIRAYAWKGPFDRAIDLYYHLIASGIKPNKYTFTFVLKACCTLQALEEGAKIHNHAKRMCFDCDPYISTSLIDMYMKCGRVDDARLVFSRLKHRDTVSWNAMVSGCSLHGLYDDAVAFVLEMQRKGASPNVSTMVGLLPVVGQAKALFQGKSIHGFFLRRFFDQGDDVVVNTAILDMYAKCALVGYARAIFNRISFKNEVSWSAMIGGYVQCDKMVDALVIFDRLMLDDATNMASTSLACVLRACASLSDLKRGKKLHCYLVKSGFLSDITVGNSLLSMYSKVGSIHNAVCLFDEMDAKDTVSYSAIISGCVQNGRAEEALAFFRRMQLSCMEPDAATMVGVLPACSYMSALRHGSSSHGYLIASGIVPNVSICNALIDMYAKCTLVEYSYRVMGSLPNPDAVAWNSIIAASVQNGNFDEGFRFFRGMLAAKLKPMPVTFSCLMPACAHLTNLHLGKQLHTSVIRGGFDGNVFVQSALVDMYAKCGNISVARRIFDSIPSIDMVAWTAMIMGYALHGPAHEALRLFRRMEMENGKPNYVAFVAVLTACSHAGLVDEGIEIFESMEGVFGIRPELIHYGCMVDIFARAGHLRRAYEFILRMPMEPNLGILSALLSACSVHGDLELGELISSRIDSSLHQCSGVSVILSNLYANSEQWRDVILIRRGRKEEGSKPPGQSWIEIRGVVQEFVAGDRVHPLAKKIEWVLNGLAKAMEQVI